jgi:hypothetical protein
LSPEFGPVIDGVHGYNDLGLPFKQMYECLELVFNVTQFEKRRCVVTVLPFSATALFFVALADIARSVFHRLVVKGLVAEAFGSETFEGEGETFGLPG